MKKVILLIFIIACILRFYRLGEVPVGLHRDEAFLGYNAYSILKTGKDMTGNFLPLHFESFLYSPGGYSYFSLPFIAIFDLNAFSTRFASAFFGSLTVLLTFFLTKEIFSKNKYSLNISAITIFLLAISPWHINLSRTATENTLVVFFVCLGVLTYLRWLKNNSFWLLAISFLSFFVTIFIYQAPRVFVPMLLALMIFIFRKNITGKQIYSLLFLYLLLIIFPLILIFSSKDLALRARTVGIFATEQTQLVLDEEIREDGVSEIPVVITRVFHNKFLGYSMEYLQNYFKHFTYSFLFDYQNYPDRYKIPLTGLLYVVELPLLLFGIIFLIEKREKIGFFLLSWLFISPIGSSFAFDDVPNMQRTLVIFPSISIICALGLIFLYIFLNKHKTTFKIVFFSIVTLLAYNFSFYLHQYYVHGPLYKPWYRQDGYKDLVYKTDRVLPKYKKAIITNGQSAPTIFFLFYKKYNPEIFHKEIEKNPVKSYDRVGFFKYEFSQEECPLRLIQKKDGSFISTGEKNILYINSGTCNNLPANANIIDKIKRRDNSLVFTILESV